MQKNSYLLLFIFSIAFCEAQNQTFRFENYGIPTLEAHQRADWYQQFQSNNPNFYALTKLYDDYFKTHPKVESQERREFETWMAKNKSNFDAKGNFIDPKVDAQALAKFTAGIKSSARATNSPWRTIGPFKWDKAANSGASSMGTANVRAIAVSPTNANKVLAGTISAGIWLSENKGNTWQCVSNRWLVREVRGIAFCPTNPTKIYAATDIGCIVSTDGGYNWDTTRLNGVASYPSATYGSPMGMIVSPTNENVAIFSSSKGLYQTTDGGQTWQQKFTNQKVWDMAWAPSDSAILYTAVQVSNWTKFYRSTDRGNTFTEITNGYPTPVTGNTISRALIAVSPAAPHSVWTFCVGNNNAGDAGVYGFYKSSDKGQSFSHICCGAVNGPEPPNTTTNINITAYGEQDNACSQCTWNLIFEVSDIDTTKMIAGGIHPFFSTDGGASWNNTDNSGYIHWDQQSATVKNGEFWLGNDGGIYLTTDLFISVQNKEDGIVGQEIWGFGQAFKSDIMSIGAYHMPVYIRDDATYDGWYGGPGADAMGANVNPIDDNYIYAKPWGSSKLKRSLAKQIRPASSDLGINLGYITLNNIKFHPNKYYEIYAIDYDSNQVVKSTDNATTWKVLNRFSQTVNRIEISFANPSVLLAIVNGNQLWRTNDEGKNWTNITPNSTVTGGQGFADILMSDKNENQDWLIFKGNQNTKKVVTTTDGGQSWTNVSGTLPKSNLYCGVYQRGSNDGIYLGSNLGIYYRDAALSDWVFYGDSMPATSINFLHINYAKNKIRAATDRGLWENDLSASSSPKAVIAVNSTEVRCYKTPLQFACHSVVSGQNAQWNWTFQGGMPSTSTVERPLVFYNQVGRYAVSLTVTDAMGNSSTTLDTFITVLADECGLDTVPGLALDLTGSTTDFLEVPALPLHSNNLTISAWVKLKGNQPNYAAIFMSENGCGFGFKGNDNQLQYHWKNNFWSWNSGLKADTSVWQHIALVVTPTNSKLYLNGIAASNNGTHDSVDFSVLLNKIGQDRNFGTGRNFNGLIDEFYFYNRALSQNEIREQMHLTKGKFTNGLMLYYQFNEGSEQTIFDRIGTLNATNNQGKKTPSTGPFAGGESDRKTITTNTNTHFANAAVDIAWQSGTNPNGEVVLSRLNWLPDTKPACSHYVSGDHYWIFDNYGTNKSVSAPAVLKFDTILVPDQTLIDPSKYQLYQRASLADGATWQLKQTGLNNVFSSNTGYLNFQNAELNAVNELGQFFVIHPNDARAAHLCQGDSVFAANAWQKNSGVFKDSFALVGCDSIIFWNITKSNFTPTIQVTLSVLDAFPKNLFYQWQWNSNPINGATSDHYTATQAGQYSVLITDSLGCVAASSSLSVSVGIKEVQTADLSIFIFPNPTKSQLNIVSQDRLEEVVIFDAQGKKIVEVEPESNAVMFDVYLLPAGTYFVEIVTQKGVTKKAFVKE